MHNQARKWQHFIFKGNLCSIQYRLSENNGTSIHISAHFMIFIKEKAELLLYTHPFGHIALTKRLARKCFALVIVDHQENVEFYLRIKHMQPGGKLVHDWHTIKKTYRLAGQSEYEKLGGQWCNLANQLKQANQNHTSQHSEQCTK